MPLTTPANKRRLFITSADGVAGGQVGEWAGGISAGGFPLSHSRTLPPATPFAVIGPNRNEFTAQTGRAPIVKMSRTMPPTPVAAPWNGSTALGWLCDSILNEMASPSPMSMIPAFSSPAPTRIFFDLVGNVLSSGLVFL